ncbi:MAG: NAD(P)-dependent alcohol dehydrogenase [Acidimicrobiia bacterium]|nr:NAD(P)-dependent alcohol dehydrogenase [Acidimicrobiia bacterium]
MQAIVQDRYGSTDVLRLDDIDVPEPGTGAVLIRVRAAGVDRGVWHLMTGEPYLARLAFGLRRPRNRVPGMDVAGVVERIGAGVTGFAVGEAVFGIGKGTYAEFAVAPAKKLAHVPEGLSFEHAAAVPISGLTALQAVRDVGTVQPGQSVLVIGASGGVGTYAVEIATAAGAEVTGVCSTAKMDLVRSIGAAHVVDYTQDDVVELGKRYDVVIDIAGNRTLRQLRRMLAPKGTLVIVGGEAGGCWLGGIERNLRAALWSPFIGQRMRAFISRERGEDIERLAEMIAAGEVRPIVERTFPLADAAAAIRQLEDGNARGKVVITV